MVQSDCEMIEEMFITEEFHMPRSPYECIKSWFFDAKNNINSRYFAGFDRAQQIIDHLTNDFSFLPVLKILW